MKWNIAIVCVVLALLLTAYSANAGESYQLVGNCVLATGLTAPQDSLMRARLIVSLNEHQAIYGLPPHSIQLEEFQGGFEVRSIVSGAALREHATETGEDKALLQNAAVQSLLNAELVELTQAWTRTADGFEGQSQVCPIVRKVE